MKSEKINVSLYCGAEIYCDDYIIEDVIDELDWGNILTLNETNYILVEFDPYETADIILKCVQRIITSGYSPIIAHIERYHALLMEPKYVSLLQEIGCLLQVNAYSFVDESDETIKMFAQKLLNEKKISFIGSDSHQTNHRPYMIKNGIKYIYEHCDIEYANSICYNNAKQILS